LKMPDGAIVVASAPDTPVAAFTKGKHIATTQYHPEMTHDFVAALLVAFAEEIGEDITASAAQTLDRATDITALAEWMATFYETAKPQAQTSSPST